MPAKIIVVGPGGVMQLDDQGSPELKEKIYALQTQVAETLGIDPTNGVYSMYVVGDRAPVEAQRT